MMANFSHGGNSNSQEDEYFVNVIMMLRKMLAMVVIQIPKKKSR